MKWLNDTRPARSLACVYCGAQDSFCHAKSYEHMGETLSLHECSTCRSLIYDLETVETLRVAEEGECEESRRAARYLLEAGFSSHYVASCAMAALPDLPEAELRQHVFVDIGAGMGMASYFVKTLFGLETLTVEPSYTGALSHRILGLDVHRAFFEHLPQELLARLAISPCCLHLNSVVEHLVDPFAVLRNMTERANVEVLAMIVPDGNDIDFDGPFLGALPFLAPRDHLHLPSRKGVEMLLARLGFEHIHVERTPGLLTGVGSRQKMSFPTDRLIKLSERVLLENMMRHPDPMVAAGGASRLLPGAVINRNETMLADLRRRMPFEAEVDDLKNSIERRRWNDLPFHLGPSCYWLAYDAMAGGRLASALSLLDVTERFADLISEDYPQFALSPMEFKWAGLLLRSHVLTLSEKFEDAEAPLLAILASRSDPARGARQTYLTQAEEKLSTMRANSAPAKQPRRTSTPTKARRKANARDYGNEVSRDLCFAETKDLAET